MDDVVRFATVTKRVMIELATRLIDRGCSFKDGVLFDGDEPVLFATKAETDRLYFIEFTDSSRFYWVGNGSPLPTLGEFYSDD